MVKKKVPQSSRKKPNRKAMARTIGKQSVKRQLDALDGWMLSRKHDAISKRFTFPTFTAALAFVTKIAVQAELMHHHPDIELSYGMVKVKLSTHDAHGLTDNDFELARRIDKLKPR